MNIIAPLLLLYALVAFTTPSGNPIWVNPDQVTAVTHSQPYDCKDGSNTKIIFSTGYSCVREEPDAVIEKLSK